MNVCIGSFYSCRNICLESCLASGTTGSALSRGLLIKVSFKNKKRHPSLCIQPFTPSHHCRAAGRHTSGDSSVSANGGSEMSARIAPSTQLHRAPGWAFTAIHDEKKRRERKDISRRQNKICLQTSTPIRESTRTSPTKKISPKLCMHFVDVGLPFLGTILSRTALESELDY